MSYGRRKLVMLMIVTMIDIVVVVVVTVMGVVVDPYSYFLMVTLALVLLL